MKSLYRLLLIISLFIGTVYECFPSSSISIYKADTASFPNISAQIFFFKDGFIPDKSITKNNITITENGLALPVNDFSCPEQNPYNNLSLAISFDLSSDTSNAPLNNFELAKTAARKIIQNLNIENTETAIISFDFFSYLNCDYTRDRAKLINTVNKLVFQKNSSFNSCFLTKPAGSLGVSALGKYQKSIIVISDGIGFASVDSIITRANEIGAKIFWLEINNKLSNSLKQIANNTSGFYFDEITDEKDLDRAINHILSMAYGYKPCTLTWSSTVNCDSVKNVSIKATNYPAEEKFSYFVPITDLPRLLLDPPYLGFSAVMPFTTRDLSVNITAVNNDIIVNKFRIMPPFSVFAGDVVGNELLIPKGKTHTVTIRFSPQDSAMVYTMLEIIGSNCYGKNVIITGGFPNVPPKQRTLSLDAPSCGETLIIGDTFLIKWSGLLPGDVVQLEYTVDGGNSWNPIANDITGLEYKWLVPNIATKQCLIRVVQLWPNNVGETLNFFHKDGVNSARFNSRPSDLLVTACRDGKARVWNSNTGQLLCELSGHTASVNWANFDPSGEYAVTASDDKTVKVWKFNKDYSSAELIHTLEGHKNTVKAANFNFNGSRIVSGSLDGLIIIWDAITGLAIDTLENISNQRIWFVNYSPLGNKIISSGSAGKFVVYNANNGIVLRTYSTGNGGETINFVSFAPDEKSLCTASSFGKGTMWDAQTGDTMFTVNHTDPFSKEPALTCTDFNFSGDFFLTSCFNNTARMWDAHNGKLIMPLVEHTGPVQTIMFNFDASRILTASMDSTAKVWNLDKRDLQADTTDCPLTIGTPSIASNDIDFGPVLLDKVKDVFIPDFIKNQSDFPFTIKEINIVGDHPNDFTLSKGSAPYKIDSNGIASAEISFQPLAIGKRNAIVQIIIPLDTIEIKLTGEGIEPGLALVSKYIDFGKVQIGDFKDSSFVMIVQNRSSINDIKINNISISGPDFIHFSILDGDNPVVLKPGEKKSMQLRFLPEFIERTSSGVTFDYEAPGSPSTIYLIGEGIHPVIDTVTIAIGSITAKPNRIIEVPVYVKNLAGNSFKQYFSGFFSELSFNVSLLEPLDNNFQSYIKDDIRTLNLMLPSAFSEDSVLTTLRFKTALGNAESTKLSLSNTSPVGKAKIVINEESGLFSLDGICYEGGGRLIDLDSRFSLHQNRPNPVETTTSIDFEAGEPGIYHLYVADLLGNTVCTLLNKFITAGTYSLVFNSSGLPAGSYYYVLQTPSQQFTRRLDIVR